MNTKWCYFHNNYVRYSNKNIMQINWLMMLIVEVLMDHFLLKSLLNWLDCVFSQYYICILLYFKTLKTLKGDILNYQPERSSVSTANILLVGQIGAGKSSVFNSVNSIFRGKITGKARSGSFEHSLTIAVGTT